MVVHDGGRIVGEIGAVANLIAAESVNLGVIDARGPGAPVSFGVQDGVTRTLELVQDALVFVNIVPVDLERAS